MKSSSNRLIVAILIVAALAIGFYVLLLSPKQQEADQLGAEVDALQVTLAEANNAVASAEQAKQSFDRNYRQLVVLGEAVPEGDETASLLVELSRLAKDSEVSFEAMQLNSGTTGTVETPVVPPVAEPAPSGESGAVPAAASVPPTEAAASLMPLGATIGPAGLAVMPYTLSFSGSFFEIADFIHDVDQLVETKNANVGVDGRLVTIDGFSLNARSEEGGKGPGNRLDASFAVTTYVIPPGQGVTAGATPTEPAPATTTAASAPESGEAEAGAAQ